MSVSQPPGDRETASTQPFSGVRRGNAQRPLPRLVVGTVTPFGHEGPDAGLPAMDVVAHTSGLPVRR